MRGLDQVEVSCWLASCRAVKCRWTEDGSASGIRRGTEGKGTVEGRSLFERRNKGGLGILVAVVIEAASMLLHAAAARLVDAGASGSVDGWRGLYERCCSLVV